MTGALLLRSSILIRVLSELAPLLALGHYCHVSRRSGGDRRLRHRKAYCLRPNAQSLLPRQVGASGMTRELLWSSIFLVRVVLQLTPLRTLCYNFYVFGGRGHDGRLLHGKCYSCRSSSQALLPGRMGNSGVTRKLLLVSRILVRVLFKLTPLSGLGNDGYVL